MSGSVMPTNLPKYIRHGNDADIENYHELLNLILTLWLNSNGFQMPQLTATQVTALTALADSTNLARVWYNSTLDKLQFMGASNTVHTITSV